MDIKNPQNLKKALAIVSTSTLLAAFGTPSVVPVLKPAVVQAAGPEVGTATSVPTIEDTYERGTELATISIKFPGGSTFKDGDFVIVQLPTDFEFGDFDNDGNLDFGDTYKNELDYSGAFSTEQYNSNPVGTYIKTKVLSKNQVKIFVDLDNDGDDATTTTDSVKLNSDGYLYIKLGQIKVMGAKEGPANVEFITSGVSTFPSGSVTVANVVGAGQVQLSVVDDDTSNNDFTVKIRVKEATPGSLKARDKSLKFTLPDGFKWASSGYAGTKIAGDDATFTFLPDKDELEVKVTRSSETAASIYEFTLKFFVDDESRAKQGDVVVKVSGDSNVNVSELVVGKYGDYGAEYSVSEVKTLFAGQDDQKLGDITIKEVIPGSFVPGRTITLTLPEGARWQDDYERLTDNDNTNDNVTDAYNDLSPETSGGVSVTSATYTGSDRRTIRLTIDRNNTSTEAKIKLKDVKIAVAPDFTGALEIEIGGSAGVTGKLKVADVVSPVDVKVENPRDVIIGLTNQQAGDLVITEKAAGALDDDDTDKLVVALPEGVTFAKLPKVEVTEGDLRLGTVKLANDDRELEIDVDNKSTKASTIRISDVALKVDRTVAEGAVNAKIRGSAVMTTNAYSDWNSIDNIAKATIANVVTPAPDAQKATVVFTVDNTKYTVNGVEKTADVAPYIKDGRTFLPVRYVAEALGVSSDNILWDAATKTVTLFKGDRVVKLKIGSKVLYVNGTAINMDVAPEIKDGRTMLPLRWVGTALGVTVEWDEEARTVTVKQ